MGTGVETESPTTVELMADLAAVVVEPKPAVEPEAASVPESARPAPAVVSFPARRRIFGRRFWRDLGIGATLVVLIHVFVVQVSVVRGLSMSPSLRDGDRLMVDRISYSMSEVARFDVVVLRYPKNPKVDFVKRIVGLPGDRVELLGGQLRVNGKTVPEEFSHIADIHATGSWTVPEDCFFVLGDNRPISCDSREFGMVGRDLLKGKVRVCFWPISRFSVF